MPPEIAQSIVVMPRTVKGYVNLIMDGSEVAARYENTFIGGIWSPSRSLTGQLLHMLA